MVQAVSGLAILAGLPEAAPGSLRAASLARYRFASPFAACGPVVRVRVIVCLHIVQVLIYGAEKRG